MRIRALLGVAAVFAAFCFFAQGQSASESAVALRTLTTSREVHNLSTEQAALAYPIQLQAVVTYYDPYIDTRHGALFVCDHSGCVFVSVAARPILPLQAGDLVEVTGVSGQGDYASIVQGSAVQDDGPSQLPVQARKASLASMLTGAVDGQWIEFEGRVRAVHLQQHNVILEIAANGGSLNAITVREPGADYEALVDSLVRIQANAAPVFNQRRQMVGVHVFFPTLRAVKVIVAAPRDPFSVPTVPISQLFRYSPVPELVHRVHVRGNVTLDWPGRILCIQDGKDGICMQTTQATSAAAGSLADVVGFPAIDQFKPTLEDASFRIVGQATAPAPRPIAPSDALNGDLDGQVVQIDAELIGRDPAASDSTLILRAGQLLFPVTLPKDAAHAISLWKEGSMLRVTGVCSVQVDPLGTNLGEGAVRPESLKILLRSADDIAVLHSPSWWTPIHALQVFAMAVVVVLAAVVWILVLRHRVEQQTLALRMSEERLRHLSEHDALTGLPNRLLLSDRLQTALKRAERFHTCLGLLMVDVDEFKEVNDGLGHHAGDKVLCVVADRLSGCVRSTDTVARMGGDEFIVLLPDLRIPPEAEMIAAKIVAAISSPVCIDQSWVAVTVSVGVATSAQSGTDAETLLRCADEAMYAAKKTGHNSFQVYRSIAEERSASGEQVLRQIPAPTGGA
jgi:diguanylate cyclase (GGDEF)-like protein